MMEYKGYLAKVEYDDSLGMLHGQVINAAPYPIATFEASDVDSLKREFYTSIDDYLAWCEEDGVEPRRGFSGKLNLRLGPDLHRQVSVEAAAHNLSINEWITQTIAKEVGGTSTSIGIRRVLKENDDLFKEAIQRTRGVTRYLVNNVETGDTYRASSIYVQPNDREIHITESALEHGRFPNNDSLYEFVRDNEQGTRHGQGNPAYAYVLEERHIPEMIGILRAQ